MLLSRCLRAVLGLALFTPLATAGTLTVGPAGSGAQFTEIQAAIDAAVDDDVILVKPGTYASIVVDEPLRILGDGTGTVRIQAPGGTFPVRIRDIGAGKDAVVSGFESSGIQLENCAGTVVLHDLAIPHFGEVQAENCGRVLILDCRIQGGNPSDGLGAVHALTSELWIANSEITGSALGSVFGGTAPGVDLVNSKLHVWRSRIQGGGPARTDEGAFGGAAGISAIASSVDLFGGPGTTVVGGPGATPIGSLFNSTPGGPGMDLFSNSHARIQDDAVVQGGLDGLGLVRAPGVRVDGTSSFTLDPKTFPTLVSSAQHVQLGSTFALTLTGNPGGYQVLFSSLRTGPTTIYRRVDGFGLLDRANMRRIASEVLPPSATFTLNLRVPNSPALIGTTVFFQAAEQVGNAYAIGNPVLVTITG